MTTQAQRRTYEFIKHFILSKRYAPTMMEIAKGIGIKSKGVVHRHVQALVNEGLLNILPNQHRNIRLTQSNDNDLSIPLVGEIAAGKPIEAIAQQEYINFAELLAPENHFALRVRGDSMIEEGIFDNDLVICKQAQSARNGDIVVALIDNDHATLKRFYSDPQEHTITLKPANSAHQPQIYSANQVRIQGIFIGLCRLN